MVDCKQGTCDQIKNIYEHSDKEDKELRKWVEDKFIEFKRHLKECANGFMKKPNTAILCVFLAFFLGSIFGSIYNFYKIYYMAETVPKVEAAENTTREKVYKIENDHTVLTGIVKQLADTQDKFFHTIDEQRDAIEKNQERGNANQRQLIEVTTQLKNVMERSKETNDLLLKELKRRDK